MQSSRRRSLANSYRKKQWENPFYLAMTTVFAAVFGGIGTLLFVSIQGRLYSLLMLSFLAFITTIYAWLYFSRILVFVEESPAGEFCSFLLAAAGFGAPIALAALGKSSMTYWALGPFRVQLWAIVGSIPVVLWGLKCIQLRLMLQRDSKKDHPLYAESMVWLTRTLIYALLIGAPIIYAEGDPAITGAIIIVLLVIKVLPKTSFKEYERRFVEDNGGIGEYLENKRAAA